MVKKSRVATVHADPATISFVSRPEPIASIRKVFPFPLLRIIYVGIYGVSAAPGTSAKSPR